MRRHRHMLREFERLKGLDSPVRRGREFEKALAALLESSRFRYEQGSKTAKPRKTDSF